MEILIYSLHIMVCLVLIIVVLLQRGKGSDMGAMLGGGASNTVFGARGAGNFLTKITAGCAVVFMLTSLSLAYRRNLTAEDLLFDESFEAVEIPADEAVADEASSTALEEITPTAADEAPGESDADSVLEETPTEP